MFLKISLKRVTLSHEKVFDFLTPSSTEVVKPSTTGALTGLFTFLSLGGPVVTLSKHAAEAVHTLGVLPAVLAELSEGHTQPEVLVTGESLCTGAITGTCHLGLGKTRPTSAVAHSISWRYLQAATPPLFLVIWSTRGHTVCWSHWSRQMATVNPALFILCNVLHF